MDGIYTMASPSSSSLYGNVGCAIRQLILSKFPYNYFQYINVSTEVAFKNLRRQFGTNSNTEISKRKYPQLIVQPVYQVPDQDGFLQNIPLTKNDMDIQSNVDRRYLFEVIKDAEHNWALKFKLNRDRIDYDVSVIVKTLHQQLDIYKAMVNQMTWERSFYYPAALESVIPKTMVEYMGKLCNIDISMYPELIPVFLRYLNSISGYPITYKVKNASATDEFFMYYQHNLVVTYSDLSIESGNKKNMVDDNYTITFRVSVEFNLPGLYILDGSVKNMDKLKGTLNVYNPSSNEFDEFIPLFSLSNFYNQFPQRKNGLTLYGSFVFTSDADKKADSADIGLLIEPDHQKAIRFHTRAGMLDDTICQVYIMKDSQLLEKDQYSINWDTMKIEYKNPDPKATYRVAIYMNMEAINSALSNVRIDHPYDQHALKENSIDYSKSKNETNFNMDNPAYGGDTDFNVSNKDNPEEKPIPGIFRGEGLDPKRVKRNQDNMVSVPSSRLSEDAWKKQAQLKKDTTEFPDVGITPSDHRDECSFHLMAQENKDTTIYPDVQQVPSDHRDEHSFHMAQEIKDTDIYPDVQKVPSDHRDENSFHLMAQEVKDTHIYPDIDPTYSGYMDSDAMHRMPTVPGREFKSGEINIQRNEQGILNVIGEVDLDNLISAFTEEVPKAPDPIVEPPKGEDEPPKEEEKPKPPEKEVIMKYYSSIFDSTSSISAEEKPPVKKFKWESSKDNRSPEDKLVFKDSIDPVHSNALTTWSKIVSNAMLYNYAEQIAVDHKNNYTVDSDGNMVFETPQPDTNHLCNCGCEDKDTCDCGWKDRK